MRFLPPGRCRKGLGSSKNDQFIKVGRIIPYNPKLKTLARKLRKNMTFGEVLLWNELKLNQLWGFDFDRQRCIGNYIVDFYCKDLMLAIEIDGMSHNSEEAFLKDEFRENKLRNFGITVIRFAESEVKYDMVNVIRALEGVVIEIIKSKPGIRLPGAFDKSVLD